MKEPHHDQRKGARQDRKSNGVEGLAFLHFAAYGQRDGQAHDKQEGRENGIGKTHAVFHSFGMVHPGWHAFNTAQVINEDHA